MSAWSAFATAAQLSKVSGWPSPSMSMTLPFEKRNRCASAISSSRSSGSTPAPGNDSATRPRFDRDICTSALAGVPSGCEAGFAPAGCTQPGETIVCVPTVTEQPSVLPNPGWPSTMRWLLSDVFQGESSVVLIETNGRNPRMQISLSVSVQLSSCDVMKLIAGSSR